MTAGSFMTGFYRVTGPVSRPAAADPECHVRMSAGAPTGDTTEEADAARVAYRPGPSPEISSLRPRFARAAVSIASYSRDAVPRPPQVRRTGGRCARPAPDR